MSHQRCTYIFHILCMLRIFVWARAFRRRSQFGFRLFGVTELNTILKWVCGIIEIDWVRSKNINKYAFQLLLALRPMTLSGFHVPHRNHNSSIRCLGIFSLFFFVRFSGGLHIGRNRNESSAVQTVRFDSSKSHHCEIHFKLCSVRSSVGFLLKMHGEKLIAFSVRPIFHTKLEQKWFETASMSIKMTSVFFSSPHLPWRGFALIIFSTVCYLISSIDRRHRSASLQCLLYLVFFSGHFELYLKISRF